MLMNSKRTTSDGTWCSNWRKENAAQNNSKLRVANSSCDRGGIEEDTMKQVLHGIRTRNSIE